MSYNIMSAQIGIPVIYCGIYFETVIYTNQTWQQQVVTTAVLMSSSNNIFDHIGDEVICSSGSAKTWLRLSQRKSVGTTQKSNTAVDQSLQVITRGSRAGHKAGGRNCSVRGAGFPVRRILGRARTYGLTARRVLLETAPVEGYVQMTIILSGSETDSECGRNVTGVGPSDTRTYKDEEKTSCISVGIRAMHPWINYLQNCSPIDIVSCQTSGKYSRP